MRKEENMHVLRGARGREGSVPVNVLERILNEMHSYVYVSDPDTDIVLYTNERLIRDYALEASPVGMRCWEVLRKGEGRCAWCPLNRLRQDPSAVVEWEEYGEDAGRYYRNTDCLIDWPDGRKAHLHHRVDVTDLKSGSVEVKKRLEQQELMAAISRSFITTADLSTLIYNALGMSGEFLGVSKMLIARLNKDNSTLDAEYVWYNPAQDVYRPLKTALPFHPGAIEYDAYMVNKLPYLAFEDITGLEALAYPASHGIKSLIGVPIFIFGSFWGLISINDCRRTRAWTASDVHLVELIGTIISGVIERHITEQKLASMSSLVNSSPQCICYLDQKGRFQYCNPGGLRQFGYAEWEVAGKDLAGLFGEDAGVLFREDVWERLHRQGTVEYEAPFRTKSGEERIMAVSAFITDFNDLGVGMIASDVSETRQLQKELLEAKEDAIRSSVAKSDFLSRMSHEMRTPLNAIIGMTGIARASADEAKRDYCLEKIDEASTHLLGVINDVLDISKIEANKLELADTEFELEDMLRRIINVVLFRIEEKEQVLVVSLDPHAPTSLVADEQRLSQVLANLLSNAVKFTPEGGTISMAVAHLDEDDGLCTLRLSVKDTGIGLSEEQKARLFQSFAQADGTIARRFGGTGLGLAISKRIVELMGGAIWVESVVNEGAAFIFTIKAGRGSGCRGSFAQRAADLAGMRFLVADPSPDLWTYFSGLGEALAVRFDCARAMDAVFDMLENDRYDAAFLDWKLAGEEGVRRVLEAAPDLPVTVMSSAAVWSDIRARARELGASSFAAKPLFASGVIECIRECLGHDISGQQRAGDRVFTPEPGCFAGRRMLLAEDIAVNREIVAALLEETGIAIDCAVNGREAYELFRERPETYDLIFMDIHMPEMDGYEATRNIRALNLPRARVVPVIAMTANVFREDIERCLDAGMDDHIGKPLATEELFSKLCRYLP